MHEGSGGRVRTQAVSWDAVAQVLPAVAEEAEVITDNSRSVERLSFDDANPRVIVAVGAILSPRLTLEGLAVSFFVRTPLPTTLFCRWGAGFGYRHGTRT